MSKKNQEVQEGTENQDEVFDGITDGLDDATQEGISALEEAEGDEVDANGKKKKKSTKKLGIIEALDAESYAKVEASVQLLSQFKDSGFFSEDFFKLFNLALAWNKPGTTDPTVVDKSELDAAKEATIALFGESAKLKDYFDEKYKNDASILSGIRNLISILNNMFSFYHRREKDGDATPRVKKSALLYINLKNPETGVVQLYQYSPEIADLVKNDSISREEKINSILAHKDTKPAEVYEIL
jgi:hypothetical protein